MRHSRARLGVSSAAVLAVASIAWSAAPSAAHRVGQAVPPACTTSWNGGTGHWEAAASWSNGVPGPSAVACILANSSKVTLSSVVSVYAVRVTQSLVITAPGALLVTAPRTVHSQIANLTLDRATLGGPGWVEATGMWTMQSVATMTTRWPEPHDGTVPPDGGGITEITSGATLAVVAVAPSPCGYGSQVVDGRTIQNDAGGTFRVSACSFFAADWGTLFDNRGAVQFDSNLGFYEGFLAGDPWPTTPPLFVNNGTVTKRNANEFVLAARYSGSGAVIVSQGGKLSIPDHAASLNVAFRTAPNATAALGGCALPYQSCAPKVSSAAPVLGTFRNAKSPGSNALVSLRQDPTDRTGQVYVTTPRTGGTFQWPVTKGSFAYTEKLGRATNADPYVIGITLDKSLRKNKAASEFNVGLAGKVIDRCSKAGHAMPCLDTAALDTRGNLQLTIKSVGPPSKQFRFFPLGPRLYK